MALSDDERGPVPDASGAGAGRMRVAVAVLRLAVAALVVAAIVGQLLTSLDFWRAAGVQRILLSVANFFSFFTIESNAIAAVVLVLGGVLLIARRREPAWLTVARLCATTYMVTTGVVYNLLLRGIDLPQGSTLAWSNEVLHVIGPVALLLDWLLARTGRPLPYRALWVVAAFPIAWIAYTLVRGPITPNEVGQQLVWYPYPFLNPALSDLGYWSVAIYVVVIAALIVGVGALLLRLARSRRLAASSG